MEEKSWRILNLTGGQPPSYLTNRIGRRAMGPLLVVMDDCIKKEEKKIGGLLHLFGKKYLQFRGRHTFKRLSNLKNIIFEIEARDLIFRQLFFFLSAVG